jgi:hypothetical protein
MVYFAWWIPYTIWMICHGLKLPVYPPQSKKADDQNSNNAAAAGATATDATKDDNNDKLGSPQPKYDTVFHSLWRGGPCELVGSVLWKRSKSVSHDQTQRNDFEVRDFLVYMVGHAVACSTLGIGVVAGISYVGGQFGHGMMLWLATLLCVERGAQRYTYYVTAMYGQHLRKAYKKTIHTKTTPFHSELVGIAENEESNDDNKASKL